MEPLTYLNNILTEIKAIRVVNKELKFIPRSFFEIVNDMYADVNINIPIAKMDFSDDEKNALTTQVLDEMIVHFEDTITKVSSGLNYNPEEHSKLASKVDPLWRELSSLYADYINEPFFEVRPKDSSELAERISILENVVGLTRSEIKENFNIDPSLRKIMLSFGLTNNDL